MRNTGVLGRVACGVVGAMCVGGCGMWGGGPYRPGGSGYSDDTFTYVSESWTPTNVSVVDTRTGQTVWSVEIPVGQQCVVRFHRGTEPDNEVYPDTMRWQLMTAGKETGDLHSVVAVPPASARRVDVSLREGPEMPRRPEPASIAGSGVAAPSAAAPARASTGSGAAGASGAEVRRGEPAAEVREPAEGEPQRAAPPPPAGRRKIPVP